jgi:hypothetical protein
MGVQKLQRIKEVDVEEVGYEAGVGYRFSRIAELMKVRDVSVQWKVGCRVSARELTEGARQVEVEDLDGLRLATT